MRVIVAVVGDHVPGGDIGADVRGAVDSVGLEQMLWIDEERRLPDPRAPERGDQRLGALVGGEERAVIARHIVEGQRDALLRVGRNRAEQHRQRQRDPRHPDLPTRHHQPPKPFRAGNKPCGPRAPHPAPHVRVPYRDRSGRGRKRLHRRRLP